jgi:hypothetical protein
MEPVGITARGCDGAQTRLNRGGLTTTARVEALHQARRRRKCAHCGSSRKRRSAPRYRKEKARISHESARALNNNNSGVVMRAQWFVAIHQEDQGERSLISENHFVHFADVHATMKKNKGKAFVVRIPKTAKRMEVEAFHNLKKLGYLVEAQS